MGHRRAMGGVAALLAGALALTACGGSDSGSGGSGTASGGGGGGTTLKIGFMGDLTGENSGIVIPPRNGAKLAIDEYNKTNPGTKLELVEYDSQGSPDQAVPLAQQAINSDKITALIGPAFSGESRAVVPILEQAKIPSVSPSATAVNLASNGWKYWHRVVANDDFQGPAIADFLVRAKSPKTGFVVSDDQEYSVGIAEAVKKEMTAKGVTVGSDRFAQSASDYSSTVSKVKAAKPDVIFYGGYYAQAGRLLKQLRDAGVTATFASGDGSADKGIIEGAGKPAAEGAVLGCPCAIPGPGATEGKLKDYYTKYKAAYNIDPAIYASEGYDAATAIIKAVQAGKTTADDINTFLASENFEGIAKPVKFKANGEVEATDIFVHEVKAGAIELLGNAQTAKLLPG